MQFSNHGTTTISEPEEHVRVRHGGHHITLDPASQVRNCTVAYMTPCLSLGRCRSSCQSMGAARYRWFHEHGCCECIGSTCLDFGKGEPHCLKCPDSEGRMVEEAEEYYYEEEEYEEGLDGELDYGDTDREIAYEEDYEDGYYEEETEEEEERKFSEAEEVENVEAEINSYLNGYLSAAGNVQDVDEVRIVGGLD